MSIASVRLAVRDFFKPPAIDGLNYVYLGSIPRTDNPMDWAKAGQPNAAFAISTIENRREHRVAFGGGGPIGKKREVYEVGLIVIIRSAEKDPEDAVAFQDSIVEQIVDRLHRRDAEVDGFTLNGAVFSAGQGAELGLDDVLVEFDLPKLSKQMLEMWCAVRFAVVEWVTA